MPISKPLEDDPSLTAGTDERDRPFFERGPLGPKTTAILETRLLAGAVPGGYGTKHQPGYEAWLSTQPRSSVDLGPDWLIPDGWTPRVGGDGCGTQWTADFDPER
jgi:hypothetical protein